MSNPAKFVQLLDQVTAILELRKKRQPVPGENFNVFSVLGMESDEVRTHCRLLYELLSPNGSHDMGDNFLQAFFELVLHKPYTKDISVYREYKIDGRSDEDNNYGRIDLLLQGNDFCYPIEVKIYAGDQWEQVKRYAEFASKAKDSQVYYLTLDGHEPSENSKKGTEAVCISFDKEIKKWLLRCGEIAWNTPSVAETIQQYIKLLDKLSGNTEDIFMDQIEKIISMSQRNFESALAISKSITHLRAEMLKQVFWEIEDHMAQMKNPLEKVSSSYEDKALYYCQNAKGGLCPALDYRLADCGELTVELRFEIGWRLYFGLTFADKKTGTAVPCPKELHRLSDAFPSPKWKEHLTSCKPMTDWFLWWKYLPDDTPETLDFKHSSGRYTELFDPEKHKVLMRDIFGRIDRHIETIRRTGLYD